RLRIDGLAEPAVDAAGPFVKAELLDGGPGDPIDRQVRVIGVAAYGADRRRAIAARHHHVEHDNVRLAPLLKIIERVATITGRMYVESSQAQEAGQQFALV